MKRFDQLTEDEKTRAIFQSEKELIIGKVKETVEYALKENDPHIKPVAMLISMQCYKKTLREDAIEHAKGQAYLCTPSGEILWNDFSQPEKCYGGVILPLNVCEGCEQHLFKGIK